MTTQESIDLILYELAQAEVQHPRWPDHDIVHATAIMIEEAGESMQAALDLYNGKETTSSHLLEELAQTAAMCIRTMMGLQKGGHVE